MATPVVKSSRKINSVYVSLVIELYPININAENNDRTTPVEMQVYP